MRDYGTIYSQFWTDAAMQSCSPAARLLACYLLTGPHTTQLGAFRLPIGYIVDDLGPWFLPVQQRLGNGSATVPEGLPNGSATVPELFGELFRNGFATYSEPEKWVHITKFLKWNPPQNPNQVAAVLKLFSAVPESCCFYTDLSDSVATVRERFRNRSETVSQPETETETGTEPGTVRAKQKKRGISSFVQAHHSSSNPPTRASASTRTHARGRTSEGPDFEESSQESGINGFERETPPILDFKKETAEQRRERIRIELMQAGVPNDRLQEKAS